MEKVTVASFMPDINLIWINIIVKNGMKNIFSQLFIIPETNAVYLEFYVNHR